MTIEEKLGYDRIRAQVEARCATAGARRGLAREEFSRSPNIIERRHRLADQMRNALGENPLHCADYVDIEDVITKLEVEGTFLTVEEVAKLGRTLGFVADALKFLEATDFPELKALGEAVDQHPEIARRIDELIDRFGQMRDSASPELADIRRQMRLHEGRAAKKLQQVLASARTAGIVDADAALSIRDGRAVIPVAAANKRKLPGFIHDESASGRTFYIEPVEVVEINNAMRELEYAERREIVRVLTDFSAWVRPSALSLRAGGELLCTLDLLNAKARFAADNQCVMPILSRDGTLELRKARHPLLEQTLRKEGREIVPLDLILTRQKHILVISGPNAGGKSVCLKTVGLLQWMFQCGMPVPALENSQMPIFDDIFIDIGDQQSIDNDLSTYSSHLLNMKRMLAEASRDSLLLIDEFGTGTEPVMGGAIAEALLQKYESRGCYGVITTHYSNLKYYADKASGVVNGAMMFDVANIAPLFRLEMGVPGSSFAVEIARKIGLPDEIIRSASEKAGTEHVSLERQLREIARDRRYWEQKRDKIHALERRIELKEEKLDDSLAGVRAQRAEILRGARDEASRLTKDANKLIESTIKVIRESQADRELTRLARAELDGFRDELSAKTPLNVIARSEATKQSGSRNSDPILQRHPERSEGSQSEPAISNVIARSPQGDVAISNPNGASVASPLPRSGQKQLHTPPSTLHTGSKVRITGQDTVGEIQAIKGKKATVAFGSMTTTIPLERLVPASNAEYRKQNRPTSTMKVSAAISERKLNFTNTIDVRGMRVDEAVEAVRDFIDSALMLGVSEVTILHGKGTGALKEEIRRYLRGIPAVSSAADEHPDRGGAGITIVRFE